MSVVNFAAIKILAWALWLEKELHYFSSQRNTTLQIVIQIYLMNFYFDTNLKLNYVNYGDAIGRYIIKVQARKISTAE